jgi:prophage regulatory protein
MISEIHRLPDVLTTFGVSRSHIYQQVKDGLFVKPIRLGKRAVGWPSNELGALLSARVPHMHVVMLPLRNGKLTAKEICGYKSQQRTTNDDYFKNVAQKYGIYKPTPSHLIPPQQRVSLANEFLDTLIRFPEKLTEYRDVLERVIQTNPLPLLNAIGIHPNIKGREEFVEIMTK